MSDTNDLQALSKRIDALQREIEELAGRTDSRMKMMAVLLVIITCVLGGYFAFAYNQLAAIDTQVVVANAKTQLAQALPGAEKRLIQEANLQAPAVVDVIENVSRELPASTRERFQQWFSSGLQHGIIEFENQVIASLGDELDRLIEKHKDVPKDKRTDVVLEELAQVYHNQTIEAVDTLYDPYRQKVRDVSGYVHMIAHNEADELTVRQQMQRELLQTFFVMYRTWKLEEPGTTLIKRD